MGDRGDEIQVLDMERLEMSSGGDRELMQELALLYLADTDAKVPEMLAAVAAGELERVGRVAHGLKGASASLGCDEAAAAFKCVEYLGREGDEGEIDAAVERAQAAWRRACDRLRELAA